MNGNNRPELDKTSLTIHTRCKSLPQPRLITFGKPKTDLSGWHSAPENSFSLVHIWTIESMFGQLLIFWSIT